MMNIRHYHVPDTTDEAYELFKQQGKNRLLAGGAWLKFTKHPIDHLIDLKDLDLAGIQMRGDMLTIGAMTPLQSVVTDPLSADMPGHALSDALRHIMGPAVRNIATLGGSVMGRFGFSDVITVLLALDARLIFHQGGEMSMTTFLGKRPFGKDILKTVLIPTDFDHTWFHKVSTTRLDFATLNIAIAKTRRGIRIAIGSRPQMAVLAEQAMAFLDEQEAMDKSVAEKAADLVCDEIAFSSDTRASGEYRKTLAREYVSRGLKEVYG